MNKRKSLLLITLIIVFFAGMYALLSIASRKALLDFGAILGKSNYRMLINNLIIGTPIDEVSQKLEYEVKPVIGRYVSQHEQLYNAFYNYNISGNMPFYIDSKSR